jgi:hypothetical protein
MKNWFLYLTVLVAGMAWAAEPPAADQAASIDVVRTALGKYIETQQIITKERKEWQQGKEILQARIELVKGETTALREKIKAAEGAMTEADKRKAELFAQNDKLKDSAAQLAATVTGYEADVRKLYKQLPEPLQQKLMPLFQRVPEDPSKTRVSVAERFQNMLGILNEVNKANNEITVVYEVRNLADGKPAEVRTMYVGLAQAYFVSARGEAGIGRPTPEGWRWETANQHAPQVALALEILQAKHSPAFVPLPMKLQ